MRMTGVLNCCAGTMRRGTEVKRPKHTVAHKECPREKQRQELGPDRLCRNDSSAPPAHDTPHSIREAWWWYSWRRDVDGEGRRVHSTCMSELQEETVAPYAGERGV